MENSSEKSKFKQYRDSQKIDDKYPPVVKYMGPSSDSALRHKEISRPPVSHSKKSGNDR